MTLFWKFDFRLACLYKLLSLQRQIIFCHHTTCSLKSTLGRKNLAIRQEVKKIISRLKLLNGLCQGYKCGFVCVAILHYDVSCEQAPGEPDQLRSLALRTFPLSARRNVSLSWPHIVTTESQIKVWFDVSYLNLTTIFRNTRNDRMIHNF